MEKMQNYSQELKFEKAFYTHQQISCIQKWMNRFSLINSASQISSDENPNLPRFISGRAVLRFSPKGNSEISNELSKTLERTNAELETSKLGEDSINQEFFLSSASEFKERLHSAIYLDRNC
jgi:hypothetical protein